MNQPETGLPRQSSGPNLDKLLKSRVRLVSDFLERMQPWPHSPERLARAMRYSLLAGGKRTRPVLCLTAFLACLEADGSNGCGQAENLQKILPAAAALEMIHTYSLIHDDLPAMDDDDLRRGKPSNHRAFDEGTAILAGDGLLTDAFGLLAGTPLSPGLVLTAVRLVAEAAGANGMAGGQALDLQAEGRQLSLEELTELNAKKTGALFRAACQAGAVLAGAGPARVEAMRLFGSQLGIAFQITDDILDETGEEAALGKKVGKDAARGKSTWPALLGIEAARILAGEHCAAALSALDTQLFSGTESELLRYIISLLSIRAA